jgi:hypothetical protein
MPRTFDDGRAVCPLCHELFKLADAPAVAEGRLR